MSNNEKLNQILDLYEELKIEKTPYLNVFETINEFVRLRKQSFTSDSQPGDFLISRQIFDATAIYNNATMAAALLGAMWPNGARSIRIVKPDSISEESTAVKKYFKTISEKISNVMDHPKARLSLALDEYMNDQGAFGTCGIGVFENKRGKNGKVDKDNPVSYKVWDVKTMHIDEDVNGIIDTIFNETKLSVRQMVEKYTYKNCSDKVKKLYDDKKFTDKIKVLHAIMPRTISEQAIGGKTKKGMPIASYHVDLTSKHIMEESGYTGLPVIVGRFYKVPGEKYGRSAAMQALPDILEINAARESKGLAVEKLLDPPLVAYDDGSLGAGEIDTSPGAFNVLNISGRISNQEPISPLFTVGEIQGANEHIIELTQKISQAFFIDRLLDLNNDTRMTLGEAQIRNRIRGDSLTSIFDRQEIELLTEIVNRTIAILDDNDILGYSTNDPKYVESLTAGERELVIPDEIAKLKENGREWYKIQFISPAKRMQQAEELQGIYTTLDVAANVAQYDPAVLDYVNADVMLRRATELGGGPAELINSSDVVASIRQSRQEQQAAIAQMEAQRNESEVIRNMAQAQSMAGGQNAQY